MESEEITDTEEWGQKLRWILFNQQLCIPYMRGHTDSMQWPLALGWPKLSKSTKCARGSLHEAAPNN
jgi:hypothetical protein